MARGKLFLSLFFTFISNLNVVFHPFLMNFGGEIQLELNVCYTFCFKDFGVCCFDRYYNSHV